MARPSDSPHTMTVLSVARVAWVVTIALTAGSTGGTGGCVVRGDEAKAPTFAMAVEANEGRASTREAERHGKLLVGVCLSGGGSRAAYLGEQVIERLYDIELDLDGDKLRLLDEVDYISAVSGGSLAAAYHAIYWPTGRAQPKKYFSRFRKAMSLNFQDAVILKMFSWSWMTKLTFTRTQRTDLLARHFDEKIFGGAKWELLQRHARAGLAPTIMLNAVVYQSERFGFGRKFVFTTLKPGDFYLPGQSRSSDEVIGEALDVLTLDSLGLDHAHFSVARAVTASAAFPILIRPLRIMDRRARLEKTVLLGDGGIYDNLGTEAMTQRLVKVLQDSSYDGALLIVVNAEAPYEFGEGLRMVSVIHKLAESRARTLSRVLMRQLAASLPAKKKIHVVEIPLKEGGRNLKESKAIWKIPTAFKIKKKDRRLVRDAVRRLMSARRPRIEKLAEGLVTREAGESPSRLPARQ